MKELNKLSQVKKQLQEEKRKCEKERHFSHGNPLCSVCHNCIKIRAKLEGIEMAEKHFEGVIFREVPSPQLKRLAKQELIREIRHESIGMAKAESVFLNKGDLYIRKHTWQSLEKRHIGNTSEPQKGQYVCLKCQKPIENIYPMKRHGVES